MTRKTILFDIDKTLLNTEVLVETINKRLANILNTEENNIKHMHHKYRRSLGSNIEYDPKDFVKFIIDSTSNGSQKKLINIYYGKDNIYEKCLFKEVDAVLKQLKKNHTLGVFSEGIAKFQNHKFKSLGIERFLEKDRVFITSKKTTDSYLKRIPKDAIIVDDKLEIVELLDKKGFKVIWINRKSKDRHPKIPTIHNLKDLLNSRILNDTL